MYLQHFVLVILGTRLWLRNCGPPIQIFYKKRGGQIGISGFIFRKMFFLHLLGVRSATPHFVSGRSLSWRCSKMCSKVCSKVLEGVLEGARRCARRCSKVLEGARTRFCSNNVKSCKIDPGELKRRRKNFQQSKTHIFGLVCHSDAKAQNCFDKA
jgi:hypothetical protein